ncbi:quinoprotein dehydrogenase-associated SoxYZ-like carrier [Glaciimonas sp. CA11.2]|uniref:quinoprotein dehydrogenase-associated SoxYZ-like carrier n=1 Tax=unclassified Glaciimonas TaxID=2644401 RepID=UPI002AB59BA6|nr:MULTISPECIES: quinoprotein dehydrogenase-associated SoxYZ-like carrier [unclassified Glaciimonas]MDY7546998.1 quinoprotein dehydrogenase-associated SoxYZ-like carrier [Glaciimonas sp. CA11.2]MEB0011155.1 quinoprotein dehydrogenase-associated SoxYZ-like carrier [Glaciimonas sp. Cout2]MEB0081168.1 quinoprotein dehydrogenase-associated SoxYZ-like carrier [Glaciimonas sp. Gout2]MEB0164225.1 quinoprotein dehydrogenase-associated SoxYZ-like carrier [Glaciimonas sp. CA11.2]
MNTQLKVIVRLLVMAAYVLLSANVRAEIVDKYWTPLQDMYYHGKKIEPGPFIHLTAPRRADSGAQVPFVFSVDYPMLAEKYIKSVAIYVDQNPVPLAATFYFNPLSGKAEISTRIRLESDSLVHVVAQANDGRLYINAVPIRAEGGCGGTVDGDEAAAKASAGKMRLAIEKPLKIGSLNRVKLLIKHPMFTGLQKDLATQSFRPAFFINKIEAKYNGKIVMHADTFIGISEDPNVQFGFIPDKPGKLELTIKDNEGETFSASIDVEES